MPQKTKTVNKYNREVYGDTNFESVITELIATPVMQRLEGIQQHGPDSWVWSHAYITRFEHSVGVMLLLKKFGAPLKEQVAGLLHDSSHGTFSHAIDFVFGNQLAADFADKLFDNVISKSTVPKILARYGFTLDTVYESNLYPLLERRAPDLCADRIDYTFRDTYRYGQTTLAEIHSMLDALVVVNNEFVFRNRTAAKMFATKYIRSVDKVWGSPESIYFHTMIADAIRIGLNTGLLNRDDLFKLNDTQVKDSLLASGNPEILEKINLISSRICLIPEENQPDYHLKVKVRFVDPKVIVGTGLTPLSELDHKYKIELEESKIRQNRGYKVKVKTEN